MQIDYKYNTDTLLIILTRNNNDIDNFFKLVAS